MLRWVVLAVALAGAGILPAQEQFRQYVEFLNRNDAADVNGGIPNAQAWEWMEANIPFFSCPDKQLEQTYYYRWWATGSISRPHRAAT